MKDGSDVEAIKKAVAELSKTSHKLAEEVYSKMNKEQQAGGGDGRTAGATPSPTKKWSMPSSRKWTRTRSNQR